MLIGKSLIFVHNPRTGGTSVRTSLRQAVPGPYYPVADPALDEQKKNWLIHQGLGVCYQYAHRLGIDPFKLPTLVCIRNPYSHTLSGYLYLKQRWAGKTQVEATFEAYLANLIAETPAEVLEQRANSLYGPYTSFMTLGEIVPDNLTIARTESLREDVMAFLQDKVGVDRKIGFPNKNRTQHDHFSRYFTRTEEEMVYRIYRNTFENGLYARFDGLEALQSPEN